MLKIRWFRQVGLTYKKGMSNKISFDFKYFVLQTSFIEFSYFLIYIFYNPA